jgi:pteridine reductase
MANAGNINSEAVNKTAIVTGAAKRIGKAVAEHLASRGWSVLIHYNSSEKLAKKLIHALKQKYPDQQFGLLKANLAVTDEVEDFFPHLIRHFEKPGLLINNASLFQPGSIHETDGGLLDVMMKVNLKTPFILMRDFQVHCRKGNIINMVDTRITNNQSDFAAYSLSKKALWELTRMAALEFAPAIRVNAIAPGVTLAPVDKDEAYLQNLAARTPMQIPGGVKPILHSVDYILENEHLTGQLLFADGGENLGVKKKEK